MDALDTLDIQSMPADRAVAGTATAAAEAKMTAASADPAGFAGIVVPAVPVTLAGIVASARIAVLAAPAALVVAVALAGVVAAGSGIAVAVQTAASAAAQQGIAVALPGIAARTVEP